MSKQSTSAGQDRVGLLASMVGRVRLWWRLFRDPREPGWTKAIPILTILYLLFPVDLIADPLLGVGQLDDLAVILLGMELFTTLSPAWLVQQLSREIGLEPETGRPARSTESETVDGTYRVIGGEQSKGVGGQNGAEQRDEEHR